METFLIRALQLVLSLSLLVIIHEGGHFFFARLFKIRVEKFYIFFDPWFSLFKFKPKNSETESFEASMATPSGHDRRSIDEFFAGFVYLFYDSVHLGRSVYRLERHELWNEV